MIHPNELRKGNWFNTFLNDKFKAEELRRDFVMGISENGFCNTAYSEIEPIALTGDILEKAGFKKFGNDYARKKIILHSRKIGLVINLKTPVISSLHQLQNYVFATTGEELEIKSPE